MTESDRLSRHSGDGLTPWRLRIENYVAGLRLPGAGRKGESGMRMWLLLILFVCLAGALYLGFGQPRFGENTAALISELEDM